MRDLATEAELDAALAKIGRTGHISSLSVDAELLELNRRLRVETVRDNADEAAPQHHHSRPKRPMRAAFVGIAAAAVAAFTFFPAVELWPAPDEPAPEPSSNATPAADPPADDLIPEWLPVPDGISASAVAAAGADIIIDFAAEPTSLSANGSTLDPEATQDAINTNYLLVGLCMWANEWTHAHTANLAERQAAAVTVLQQSQTWPGMVDTPYSQISATMADAAVRGDAPAVTQASLPLFCSALDEALNP